MGRVASQRPVAFPDPNPAAVTERPLRSAGELEDRGSSDASSIAVWALNLPSPKYLQNAT